MVRRAVPEVPRRRPRQGKPEGPAPEAVPLARVVYAERLATILRRLAVVHAERVFVRRHPLPDGCASIMASENETINVTASQFHAARAPTRPDRGHASRPKSIGRA